MFKTKYKYFFLPQINMAATDALININHLYKQYTLGDSTINALFDVSFQVAVLPGFRVTSEA